MTEGFFSPQEIQLLERTGTRITAHPGSMIYFEGEPAEHIYFIQKGRVRVFQNTSSGREVNLDVVAAGHIIGESAFTPGSSRPTCVQAVNTVHLVCCRITDLMPYLQKEPTLALHLLQHCCATMDRLANRLQEQCLLDRYGKVASFILDLSETDSPEKGTVGGTIPYTHENLAESLGLSRPTVTAVLRQFQDSGWIQLGYRWLKVLDRRALRDFVECQKNQS